MFTCICLSCLVNMGKVKTRKRNKKSKPFSNSIDIADGKNGAEYTEEENEYSKIVSDIIEKLESTAVMDKLSALILITEMTDIKQIQNLIIDHEICKIVAPLLLDEDYQIRINASLAIRNLSTSDEEVIEALVDQDVLTPVLTSLANLAKTLLQPADETNGHMEVEDSAEVKKVSKRDTVLLEETINLTCQIINVLWNLCENCCTVMKYVNNEDVLSVLVDFIQLQKYDISLNIASAQFLQMLSEDNNLAMKYLSQREKIFHKNVHDLQTKLAEQSSDQLNGSWVLLLVLSAGILQNIGANFLVTNFQTILKFLDVDVRRDRVNKLTSDLPKSNEKDGKEQILSLTHLISAQKLILEGITNMCSPDEDEDPDSSMDVDEAADEEDVCVDTSSVRLPSELQDLFAQSAVLDKVFQKTVLPAVNVCQILKSEDDYKDIFGKLMKLQCTAYLCVNNLVSAMHIPLNVLLVKFVNLLNQYSDNLNNEQEECLTCALRSIIFTLNDAQYTLPLATPSSVTDFSPDFSSTSWTELQSCFSSTSTSFNQDEKTPPLTVQMVFTISKFISRKLKSAHDRKSNGVSSEEKDVVMSNGGSRAAHNEKVAIEKYYLKIEENLIKILSTWCCLVIKLKLNNPSHDQYVLSTILESLSNVSDLILLSEAMDSLIDLFSDDDTDSLAQKVNLVDKLQSWEKDIKVLMKSSKKILDGEKLALVTTVQTNLHAFIQYKRNRLVQLKKGVK